MLVNFTSGNTYARMSLPPGLKAKDYIVARLPAAPAAATYNEEFGEFILPYDAVREADDPDQVLLDFLHCTYEAAADAAGWDRPAVERVAHPRSLFS